MLKRHVIVALRLAVLALLALGLCLQPVLAAMGEAHEAVAHAAQAASHAHVHADMGADIDTDAAPAQPDGQAPERESPLHLLMHFTHCCGQSASVLPPLLAAVAVAAAPHLPGHAVPALTLRTRPNSLYRPPIAA